RVVNRHCFEDAGAMSSVSLDRNSLLDRISWEATQRILSSILKDKLDCFGQALPRLVLCPTLPICARDLRAEGNEPLCVTLNNSRKLVFHSEPPRWRHPFMI